MSRKTKTISFRVKRYLFDFLNEYVKDKPYDKTDVMTKLIENFYLDAMNNNNGDRVVRQTVEFVVMDKKMKEFIEEFANECDFTTRELILHIIKYFFMGYISGEFNKSYGELWDEMKAKIEQ